MLASRGQVEAAVIGQGPFPQRWQGGRLVDQIDGPAGLDDNGNIGTSSDDHCNMPLRVRHANQEPHTC